ncbi:hypothetical protein C8Q80DRAFT_1273016 [Daedaleopsis nitida]|nr:hypothetical protein C8Q80DRAFT_1273016 [Daedaleopsis nitida]
MAPVHTNLCSPNPSPYIFSAVRRREKGRPTLLELVAPSPPRRLRGLQLTVTRVFNKRPKKGKEPLKRRGSITGPSRRAGTPSATPSPKVVQTPQRDPSMDIDDDDQESSLTSLSPSPPPTPATSVAIARARASAGSGALPSILRTKTPQRPGRSAVPLTRSSSRGSVKSGSKRGKKSSVEEEIQRRLEASGGIVTRYGEQDGDPIFIRDSRVTSTTEPDVLTHFWESFSLIPLRQPPDLSSHPDLVFGDVYCNIVKGNVPTVQLWHWTREAGSDGVWQKVKEGYQREDGRQLSITPTRHQPSWVSQEWYRKQLKLKAH